MGPYPRWGGGTRINPVGSEGAMQVEKPVALIRRDLRIASIRLGDNVTQP